MGKGAILVVDDEINILNSLSGILADEGYSVSTAQNGDDALRVLQEQPCDLVLLDIWLPGRRDGLQTLKEIRRRHSAPEVVMISGHGTIDTAVRATKLGAFHFLEKPLSLSGMLETIEAALRHGAERRKEEGEGDGSDSFTYLTGCPAMEKAKAALIEAAKGSGPVLIAGPQGSGKEYSARFLHAKSPRKADTFIKVVCRRLTRAGFDGLFGTPDEDPGREGSRFSKLSGTVFLENPNLLETALQDRLSALVSARSAKKAFVAAVTLPPEGSAPNMSQNLAKCLGDAPISLPPLRERGDGITDLINNFLVEASGDFGKTGIRLSRRAMEKMRGHAWPGNVKELKAIVENAVISCPSAQIEEDDLHFEDAAARRSAAAREAVPQGSPGGSTARIPQKTVGKSVVLCGLGLHSGIKTGVIIAPLPPNSGIIFGDIATGRQVRAVVDFVESTEYATKLTHGSISVRTIEHIMATLNIYGITNALIKVGEEVPIMDGSAIQLCDLIESAGVAEQSGDVEPIVLREPILVGNMDKKYVLAEPCDRLVVEYRLDYPPPVGKQTAVYDAASGAEGFRANIAPARTFGFVEQIKKFEGKGFAEGGKLSNFILIDDERVINTTLRFENEFACHKALDLLGDIYLLGRPLFAKITASMSGHTENIQLARRIAAEYPRR
ncbi:MAG: UDP-3-O-[3-hydroxymyristoyl] N-acetylglucosamine deacetylase [Nitrospinae bacterium]|nr:UDP-3-O-[3-hydroxymyristoyl] N-acetylglucosamine deacetylase [Nitrospinota bacterium]